MDYLELVTADAAALAPGRPHIAGAVGPELNQAAALSSRRRRGPFDSPRTNARLDGAPVNMADGDAGNPQPMTPRPALRDLATGESVAIDTAMAYLPGPKPPMGWDGEHDAFSPLADD